MAYHIVRINSQKILLDGTTQIIADIDVDTAADLPEQDGIEGGILGMGSIAHDISTGDYYAMNSGGEWYNQDGSDAEESDQVNALSMSPSLNLTPQIDTDIRPAINLNALPVEEPEPEAEEEPENDEEETEGAETEPEEEPAEDGEEQ